MYDKIIGLGEKSIRKSYYPQLRKKIHELEHEIEQRLKKEDELERNYENQRIVNSLLKIALDPIPLDEVCTVAIDMILTLSWLKHDARASFFFIEDNPDEMILKHTKTVSQLPAPACKRINTGSCLCGKAALEGKTIFNTHSQDNGALHSHYCVPVRIENKTIGILSILLPGEHTYHPGEEETLEAVVNTLAGIIQRHQMSQEKIKIEDQLRQTQKMEAIGALSGGIAHDFNNLLTPILGYSEMLIHELPPDDPIRKDLCEVVKAANLAKDLVRQILAMSRQSKFELKPVKIGKIVKEAYKLLRSSIPATIEIITQIEENTQPVLADSTQIHQVLMNLCTNAYHAMKKSGGKMLITTKTVLITEEEVIIGQPVIKPGTYIMLSVSDTGIGMNKITLERIFDPYFTTKSKHEGTGLGLSVVHGIIKSFEGHITVYSESGMGSTFRIYLPCAQISADADAKTTVNPIPTGDEHIMVVDDEITVVNLLIAMLQSKGYKVTGCQSSIKALNLFEQKPGTYALIISDMTMPDLTGPQFARQCLDIRPDVPMILLSGFSDMINEEQLNMMGFQRFLMKPIILRDLCQTVREVLDGQAAPSPREHQTG